MHLLVLRRCNFVCKDSASNGGAERFNGRKRPKSPQKNARRGTTPAALRREAEEEEAWKAALCEAVVTLAKEAETLPLRVSYAEVTERFGADVFGGKKSKLALDAVKEELKKRNIQIETGMYVKRNGKSMRGFTLSWQNPDMR